MLSPESIQTSGKSCPSGIHSTLSTTTSTLDVFDFASSTRTIRTPVTTETTVPTWDGNKTNQTTFLLDLWDYCNGKPDLLTFIIHGQDQFHRCAKGYIWDCRAADECELLNYTVRT